MEYKTLIDIYNSDKGLQAEFPDPKGKGISGEWRLEDWAKKYLAVDYPNITIVQPGDPKLTAASSADTIPKRGDEDTSTLTRFESDPTRDDISTNENTVWLYNKTKKTYVPIKNEKALQALLRTDSIEEAFKHVNVLPVSAKDSPEWQGSFGSFSNAIAEDGIPPETYTPISGTEIDNVKDLYGAKQRMSPEDEAFVGDWIGFSMTEFKRNGDISEQVFKDNLQNPAQLIKYVNAMAYGKYHIFEEIYADLRAKTLLEEGDQSYANFKAFDETMGRDEWLSTEEGKKYLSNTKLKCPEGVIDVDLDLFKNPIFEIPSAAFSTLIKPIDIESPEFKAEAEEIQASYYDIMMQKAEAETDQAQAIADHNWTIFKKNLEKKHGLELSDNAKTAWGQLQEFFSGSQEAGLSGTGIEREVHDKYMKDIRDKNQLLREGKIDEEEMELRNKLLSSGSPEDIAAFVAKHGEEKAKEWGLIPSDEMKQFYNRENLKEKYPDMSDDEINTIISMVIDPTTGHYKSQLYKNLYSNKYQLGEEKKTYQWEKLFEKKKLEEQEAYAQYDKRNPFFKFKDALGEEFEEKDEGVTETEETFTPDLTSDTPTSQQAMRDAVKKHTPIVASPDLTSDVSTSQQTMRDAVKKHIPAITPPVKQPVSGYGSLVNKKGTIYAGDRGFGSNTELADYLKIKPHEINWSKIKKY